MKKKIGLIILSIWFVGLVSLVVLLTTHPSSTSQKDFIIGLISGGISILFFPVWAFLIGNKLLKIISIIPLFFIWISFLLYIFILRPHKLSGSSMKPNFVNGEYVLSEKVSLYLNTLKRGDVIVFDHGTYNGSSYFARIVGLPGENFTIKINGIYINNKIIDEPYLPDANKKQTDFYVNGATFIIPYDEYVAIFDDRSNPFWSGYFSVKKSKIIGRIFYVYWPKDRAGFVKLSPLVNTNNLPLSCSTFGTKMVVGLDGKGQIGCDIETLSEIDLSKSYCQSQKTNKSKLLIPDAFGRSNRYYATLTGLDLDEQVRVFAYNQSGQKVECLPVLN